MNITTNPELNTLLRLEQWFESMCNGDWEHTYGITIETLDNPGWHVSVELSDTPLAEFPFQAIRQDFDKDDWFQCEVSKGIFQGSCSTGRLNQLLNAFLDWADSARA